MIKKWTHYFSKWSLISLVSLACLVCALFVYINLTSPNVLAITGCIESAIHKIKLCEKNNNYTPLTLISQHLQDAIVVSEDARFYQHSGVDFNEIRNSFISNIKRLKVHRGGSTISQQLVKNVFLTPDKTLMRKLREVYLTLHVESLLSKKEILERYLNVIEFGDGIFGVKQASRHYFDKSPDEINLLEAASLAYLLPSPKKYSKVFKTGQLTEYAHWRISGVLKSLNLHRKIDSQTLKTALNQVNDFPHFSLAPQLPVFTEELADLSIESEPVEKPKTIDDLPIEASNSQYLEFDFNNDGNQDMLIFEKSGPNKATDHFQTFYALLKKGDSYILVDKIKLNLKYIDLNAELGETKSIRTFFPDIDNSGDLVEYTFDEGVFSIHAKVISLEDAIEVFKKSDFEIFEL